MKHLVTIVLLCVAGSAACARSADREVRGEEIPANLRDQPTNQPKQRFDRTGELLESKTKLEGLPLPVDLGPEVVLNGAHVYKSRLPIDKLVRYFTKHLNPEEIQYVGRGARFKHATVADVEDGPPLNVSIAPAGSQTRVEIEIIRPPPENPVPESELMQRFEDEWRKGT
ncbi:MAG: hypothetical protein R3A78_00490 [Polyangiales bacterium]|nr:hypothetical protein [Myxococcales bacterium]